WRRRLLRRLAAGAPWAGDRVARGLQESLRVYEAVRLRQRWLTRLDDVMGYWYWRGVFEEVAESTEGARGPEIGEDALFTAIAQRRESRDDASAEGVQETAGTRTRGTERGRAEGGWSAADGRSGMVTWAPDRAGREPCSADRRDVEAEVDVASGFERAEQWIDERRPRSLLVRCGRHLVGIIADEAGAEPLRGLHLRRRLATDLAPALLRALAADGQVPAILDPDRLLATLRRSSGAHSAAA
ncbi:MAG TPA: hypothetical protein VNI83_00375, partial [Vicinamibacterales bacterium]|nr:hypothetical protein [Vicinamibacterales bacterium]